MLLGEDRGPGHFFSEKLIDDVGIEEWEEDTQCPLVRSEVVSEGADAVDLLFEDKSYK